MFIRSRCRLRQPESQEKSFAYHGNEKANIIDYKRAVYTTIRFRMLLQILKGVAIATKTSDRVVKAAVEWLDSAENALDVLSNLKDLSDAISKIKSSVNVQQLLGITVAIAFLRKTSQSQTNVSSEDLDLVWRLIHQALTHPQQTEATYNVSRSAQGFLTVPLCSLLKDGNLNELFGLHVWMPDEHRGTAELAVHSHQLFAQFWVVAGEGSDCRFDVQAASENSSATHAEYALEWNTGSTSSTNYETRLVSSALKNTRRHVCAKQTTKILRAGDDTYSVPAATYHSTEVEPDAIYANIFFLDSHRGFAEYAGVLGPKDAELSHRICDPKGHTAFSLAEASDVLRSYERHMRRGQRHAKAAENEEALREFDVALNIIQSAKVPTSFAYYRHQTLAAFGLTNCQLGRHATAKSYLEQAQQGMRSCYARVNISGQLGVVYRHMGLLEDARRAAESEYEAASQLDFALGTCQALYALGVTNDLLFQKNKDPSLLERAIKQLTEQVESARSITASMNLPGTDRRIRAQKAPSSTKLELIGLSRLSYCFIALGDFPRAIASALESRSLSYDLDNYQLIAKCHYIYGRALVKSGRTEEALQHFNVSEGCSPAAVLCQQSSDENRGFLQEFIAIGGNIDSVDLHGYTPWDYTVFNGDTKTQEILLEALRRVLKWDVVKGDVEQQLKQRQKDANTKKAYRELFQEHLRPVLLKGGDSEFQTLRARYAQALAADDRKRELYDGFKFIWYSDFLKFGQLPRSTDGVTNQYIVSDVDNHSSMPDLVVFFSYRWINQDRNVSSPDDSQNTQYHRMIAALDDFLKIHSNTRREKLGIWMDFACIDQDNPGPGVGALPLNLAQCNSVITLADQEYESRAWCSVEALLAHTLQDCYSGHTWYEQVPAGNGEDGRQVFKLQQGQLRSAIPMSEKRLRFEEEDRPKIVFLERQRHLLANH
ncbi:MAG: hypothetical protein Q9207_003640 [Kuettlingeria erythrocarpa]